MFNLAHSQVRIIVSFTHLIFQGSDNVWNIVPRNQFDFWVFGLCFASKLVDLTLFTTCSSLGILQINPFDFWVYTYIVIGSFCTFFSTENGY